jgi:hypothetical protein
MRRNPESDTTMITYHLRLQPDVRSIHRGARPLTTDVLEQLIDGAIIQQLNSSDPGYPAEVEFQLEKDPSDALLNTILIAMERCGYTVADGEITSSVDAEAQGAICGLFGGAGAGALTKNGAVMIIAAAAGAIAGHVAGGKVQKHEVIYQITRPYPGVQAQLVAVNNATVPKITLSDWLALANPSSQAG